MVSLGTGAIIVAIMAVIAALTLLPAVLRLLGHRVNKGRLPFARPAPSPRCWCAIAAGVMRRPVVGGDRGASDARRARAAGAVDAPRFASVDALPDDLAFRQAIETLISRLRLRRIDDARRRRARRRRARRGRRPSPRRSRRPTPSPRRHGRVGGRRRVHRHEGRLRRGRRRAAEAAIKDLRDAIDSRAPRGHGRRGATWAASQRARSTSPRSSPTRRRGWLSSCSAPSLILLLVTFRSIVVIA